MVHTQLDHASDGPLVTGEGPVTAASESSLLAGHSRRQVLKGLAAGAAVLGWSAADRSWVTKAGAADSSDVIAVPQLDGTLETDPAVLGDFSGDFGRLVEQTPKAVLRPGSVQDVVKMVRYARSNGLKIAMNGQGGTPEARESHSNHGQALVEGGIAVDAKALGSIHDVSATSADVDAGVTWAELFVAAEPAGATPPVLTDFLQLSIGGTLSVGGIGGSMFKHGTQADNVLELEVVTGAGRLVTCSPTRNRWLFEAVLAGAGQCGLIVRAKVKLVPVETRALIFNLFYDDVDTFLADQAKLAHDERFDHQGGQIVRLPDDSGWRYMIETASYYTPPESPDQDALLEGLSDDRPAATIVDQEYRDWAFRLDPIVGFLKANGFWDQPHPWVSLVVPASEAAGFLSSVAAQLTPAHLGAGLALVMPIKTAKLKRPLFALPHPPEPMAFVLSLLRFPPPGYPDIPGLVTQNRTLHDEAVTRNGKRYIIGAVPDLTRRDWQRHFGLKWPFLVGSKAWFDPKTVLTPGQGIF